MGLAERGRCDGHWIKLLKQLANRLAELLFNQRHNNMRRHRRHRILQTLQLDDDFLGNNIDTTAEKLAELDPYAA